jgi:hypothetical protein
MRKLHYLSAAFLYFLLNIISIFPLFSQDHLIGSYTVYLNKAATGATVNIQKTEDEYQLSVVNKGYPETKISMEASDENLLGYDETGAAYMVGIVQNQTVLQMGTLYTFILEKNNTTSSSPKPTSKVNNPKVTSSPVANTSTSKSNGERITDTQNGFSFNAPSGWTQQPNQGNGYSFIKGSDNNNIIAITTHNYNSRSQVSEQSNQAQQLGNLVLNPLDAPQNYGDNGILATYAGAAQGQNLNLQVITLVSPNGGGLLITGINIGESPSEQLLTLVKSIANSCTFTAPQISETAKQWKQNLGGKQLLYLKTQNGLSDKWSYDLCPNGTFVYKSHTSYSSNTYSDSFNANLTNNETGTWKIVSKGQQALLLLAFNDGSTSEFNLRTQGEALFMNDKKYFIQPLKYCN